MNTEPLPPSLPSLPLQPPPPSSTDSREEWLAKRKTVIGSSDIAGILGADPYSSPVSVWLDKTGRDTGDEENRLMRRGRAMEPFILSEFVLETQIDAVLDNRFQRHPQHDFIGCTPDALCTGEDAGVELKAPDLYTYSHWGRSWGGEYPEKYLAQCAWQMSVKNRSHWYLTALLGRDLRVYRIERDRELEEGLIEAAAKFWRDYVIADVCPPLDASDAARAYVESRFPKSVRQVRLATPEEITKAIDLAALREQIGHLEAKEERLKTELCALIGDAEGITAPGRFKIGWKTRCGQTRTNWQAVALALNPPEALIQQNTSTGKPCRIFRPSGRMFPSRRQRNEEE